MVPVPAGPGGTGAEPALKELFSEGALRGFEHEQRCLRAQGQRIVQCQALSTLTQDPALLRSARAWRPRDCGKQGCGHSRWRSCWGASHRAPTSRLQAWAALQLWHKTLPPGEQRSLEGAEVSHEQCGALDCGEVRNGVNVSSHPGGVAWAQVSACQSELFEGHLLASSRPEQRLSAGSGLASPRTSARMARRDAREAR